MTTCISMGDLNTFYWDEYPFVINGIGPKH